MAQVEPGARMVHGNLPKDTSKTHESTSARVAHLARRENVGGHLPKSVGSDNGNTKQKQTQANVRAAAPTALFVMVFGSAQLAQDTIRLGVVPL